MVRCDICFEAADYTCADPGANPLNYCGDCLPVWLRDRAESGEFPLAQSTEDAAPKKKKAASSNADND